MDGLLVILDSEGFRNKTRKDNFKTTTELTLKPLKGLEIKANLTYMLYNQYDIRRQSNGTYSKYPGETSILNTGNFQNQMFEQFAPMNIGQRMYLPHTKVLYPTNIIIKLQVVLIMKLVTTRLFVAQDIIFFPMFWMILTR